MDTEFIDASIQPGILKLAIKNLFLFVAVLFEDAVILGIGTDNASDCFSPGSFNKTSQFFSFYNLERTVIKYSLFYFP